MVCEQDDKEALLYFITAASASLSLLGCVFILIIYAIAKELRVYAFKLVWYVAFFETIKSIVLILPGYTGKISFTVCSLQGYLLVLSGLGGLVWILAISFCLQKVIQYVHNNVEMYHNFWLFLSFILCPAISTLPFLTNSYGKNCGLCALKSNENAEIWRISIDYFPKWLSIIFIIICYSKVVIHVKKDNQIFTDNVDKHVFFRRIIAYPAIILFGFIPITIFRLFQAEGDDCGNIYLSGIAYTCYGSYGFFNAIAYGYNESINQYIRGFFKKGQRLAIPRGTDLFTTFSDVIN